MLSDQFQQVLDRENLTIYGASQIVGAETDETLNAIHKKISRLLKTPPRQIKDIEAILAALGYRLEIVKNNPEENL